MQGDFKKSAISVDNRLEAMSAVVSKSLQIITWGQLKEGKFTYAKDWERGLWAFVWRARSFVPIGLLV